MLSLKGCFLAVICALAAAPGIFAQPAVRISEVLTDNLSFQAGDDSITDWVELVNTSPSATMNLGGATLSDDELFPDKWTFPAGVSIPPNGTLVIACDQDRSPSTVAGAFLNTGFSLSSRGGGIFLFAPNFGAVIDSVRYGVQVRDYSIGKVTGVWQLCNPTLGTANVAATLGSPSSLRINEWLANTGDDDWFELYNPSALPISLEGLFFTDKLTDNKKFPVPALSFIGGQLEGFVKFIADGNTENGPDHVGFSFSKDGEEIGIYDGLGTLLDGVTFGPQALEKSEGFLPDGSLFRTVFDTTQSPGEPNYKELTSVIISEVLSHTDPPLEDAVEFYNTTDSRINIGGWYLSNKKSDLRRYLIPANTFIEAKSYLVIYENAFNLNNPDTPFTFNSAHGDQVYLAEADVDDQLTGYRAGEDFEAAENGVSFGRVNTSVAGVHQFVAMEKRTFGVDNPATVAQFRQGQGLPNSAPKVGPVVINEVNYNPFSSDGTDNRLDEFIELHNFTTNTVYLYDTNNPANTWRLQNGVSFVFPLNQTIPPGGYVLVVSFDPELEPITKNLFLSDYGLPATTKIYGPLRGDLNNSGDSLELYKPDPPQGPGHPDEGFVPYIRVDKVNYTDAAPWPIEPDGTGKSLQRKNATSFGNDYGNWQAANPTPASINDENLRDTDGDRIPDIWETANQLNPNDPSDGPLDPDLDDLTNFEEYQAGSDPHVKASKLAVTSLVPASGTEPLRITFTAFANRSYSVLYRNSLAVSSQWQKLENIDPDVNVRVITVDDAGAAERADRYYQIVSPAWD